jgi:hypothetical protein
LTRATSVTDIIRRGFESMLANWPLLLIRIAEGIVFVVIAFIAFIAAIVPLGISIGVGSMNAQSPEEVAEFILSIFTDRWLLLVYVFVVATVVLLIFVAIHSFVEAGSTRVYIDAERATLGNPAAARQQLRMFTAERWIEGGRRKWWAVFWVYNIAWGAAGLLMLAPLLLTLLVMLLLRDRQGAVIAAGCLGLAVSILFIFVLAVVVNIWSRKAIVLCVARIHSSSDALSAAWREFRADAGRHIGVTLILFLLTLVGMTVVSSFSMAFNWNTSPGFNLSVLPLQLIGSFLQTVFSAGMAAWFMASFAALTVDR